MLSKKIIRRKGPPWRYSYTRYKLRRGVCGIYTGAYENRSLRCIYTQNIWTVKLKSVRFGKDSYEHLSLKINLLRNIRASKKRFIGSYRGERVYSMLGFPKTFSSPPLAVGNHFHQTLFASNIKGREEISICLIMLFCILSSNKGIRLTLLKRNQVTFLP